MKPKVRIVEVDEEAEDNEPVLYKVWIEIEAQDRNGDPVAGRYVSGNLAFAGTAEFDTAEEAMEFAHVLNEIGEALMQAFTGQCDRIPVDRWGELATGFAAMLEAVRVPFERRVQG